jgi:enhancing lycopene biosynthesis protein 2
MPEKTHDEHAVRAALNQQLFRQVNEQMKEVNEPVGDLVAAPDWVCECADTSCTQKISLTMEEYEALRSDPTHFAVAPNTSHVFFEVENVVGQTDRYWIVQKIGTAAVVARTEAAPELLRSPPGQEALEKALD